MIVATVHYRVVPGSRDEVCRLSARIRAYARGLAGNVEYCPSPSPYEDDAMISLEKWETLAAMKAYCDSEECKRFQEARDVYLVPGTMSAQVYEAQEVPLETVMQR